MSGEVDENIPIDLTGGFGRFSESGGTASPRTADGVLINAGQVVEIAEQARELAGLLIKQKETGGDEEVARAIEARRDALLNSGVHATWLGTDVISPKNNWTGVVRMASRATDPKEPQYGNFELARKRSKIEKAWADFQFGSNLAQPMGEKNNEMYLRGLNRAVISFVKWGTTTKRIG